MGAAEKGRKRETKITVSLYDQTLRSRIPLDERIDPLARIVGVPLFHGCGPGDDDAFPRSGRG